MNEVSGSVENVRRITIVVLFVGVEKKESQT